MYVAMASDRGLLISKFLPAFCTAQFRAPVLTLGLEVVSVGVIY